MKQKRLFLTIAFLVFLHFMLSDFLWTQRYQMQAKIPAGYVIPSQYSRMLSFGNHGLLSDFLLLKVVSFWGGRFIAGQRLEKEDWDYLDASLNVVTDLDPYGLDPYFLAEGLLAWDAGMPQKANQILLKGIRHRPKGWVFQFFVGFNYFYFLNENAAAADYIMDAAKRPGSPAYLKTLASRLAYYGGKSKPALLFLQQMIAETDDPLLRKGLAKRLLALERAVSIEEAVEKFKIHEGRMPTTMREIVTLGYLAELPEDPYGGKWGILTNGRVSSTSRFADVPPQEEARTKEVQ